MSFIYLASPYSAPSMATKVARFMAARDVCLWALKAKIVIYSPIVHWHNIAVTQGLKGSFIEFEIQNEGLLASASKLYVLDLFGWKVSKGVLAEIALAKTANIPCSLLKCTGMEKRFAEDSIRRSYTTETLPE